MLNYTNPKLILERSKIGPGQVEWRSPSNLAIIKYWGKHGRQLPRNPSISFTLDEAHTHTLIKYRPKDSNVHKVDVNLYFHQVRNEQFEQKVQTFLESIVDIYPFLRQLQFDIYTSNSFPHSAGIASSASGMSALALCLCSLEQELFEEVEMTEAEFYQKASYIARLGSGSACRSVYPRMAIWGESNAVDNSSDLYAIPFTGLHQSFDNFHDDILIVHKGEKSVSSRAGHALMEGNLYADNRYTQARQRFRTLLGALRSGDMEVFGQIAENEALTLHALMMTSQPSYILMQPNSLKIIELVRAYRQDTKQPLYFSLDAGPNLHLLYPDDFRADIQAFIRSELQPYCYNGEWIADRMGEGPTNLQTKLLDS
ncbi:MAG: diphosphomevalonate decarboxylase [Bacteroidota bacterium]